MIFVAHKFERLKTGDVAMLSAVCQFQLDCKYLKRRSYLTVHVICILLYPHPRDVVTVMCVYMVGWGCEGAEEEKLPGWPGQTEEYSAEW